MRDELFEELLASAQEAVDIQHGKKKPARTTSFGVPDVRALRKQANLKQVEFARVIGVSPALIQAWEQNRRTPMGGNLKLLKMIEKNPGMINELMAV